jgi:hypothetical protein
MAGMNRRGFDKYVFRVGSSWKQPAIDEKLVAGYRFDPAGYARLKLSMDIAAGVYLTLALIALLIVASRRGFSVSGILTLIGQGLTLQPILVRLFASNTQTNSVSGSEALVLGMLVLALLVHESQWLKRKIHYQILASGRTYKGFLSGPNKPTFPKLQRTLTILSATLNHLFVLCVVLIAASLLWDVRNLSRLDNPAARSKVVLAGMLLMVIGAFEVIKVLESKGTTRSAVALSAFVAAVLSGILFGAVMAVGLNRGTEQGKRAFVFGFGLALSAWAWRHFVARPRGEPSKRVKRVLKYLVHTPLIALGRLLDLALRALFVIASVPQRIFARLAEWILRVFRPLLPYSFQDRLKSIAYAESFRRFNERSASERPFIETVSAGAGYSVGYYHRPPPVLQTSGFIEIIQSRLLRMLLEEDTWLTGWVKREPIRPLNTKHGGGWEREDPLDFGGRVRSVFGTRPQPSEVDLLYRRLLALMLAVWIVASVFDFLVGHVVSFYGRSLFDKGVSHAAFFGLAVGAFFAIVTAFGQASLGVLTLGLVSGLSLDPTLGLASGLKYQIEHDGVIFAFTFVVMSMLGILEKRALLVMGIIVFAVGLYLQFLPYLIRR